MALKTRLESTVGCADAKRRIRSAANPLLHPPTKFISINQLHGTCFNFSKAAQNFLVPSLQCIRIIGRIQAFNQSMRQLGTLCSERSLFNVSVSTLLPK
ncbi:MAG: hypothetical protein LZF64_06995 [Nitrosomonas sp.]|nr:MAG: hypothetical protein LZF64_06995 [Nitrosomonas sp.]